MKKGKVLIIGAGGVASVTAHKCAQMPEVFSEIVMASRTSRKCRKIADSIRARTGRAIETFEMDLERYENVKFIRSINPQVVINLVDPYYDLLIMKACLEAGVNYIDTANWEPKDGLSTSPETGALLRYEEQWALHEEFEKAGLMAVLGAGYDPGVTQANVAYALKHYFQEIHTLHILDCNAGEHGRPFATNFNPEINLREVQAPGKYWENGEWKTISPIINSSGVRESFQKRFPFLEIGENGGSGVKTLYLIYHEELQSLVRHIPGLRLATFGMTFGPEYLTHLRVLGNVGMTGISPVIVKDVDGNKVEIIPLQVLKELLPEPASLASTYTGKTHIACYMEGTGKDGTPFRCYIYNVCDFEKCFNEVGSQAISYTAGVPPVIAAKLMIEGKWKREGVFNVEQLPPDPFMEDLECFGLPWHILFNDDAPRFSWNEL